MKRWLCAVLFVVLFCSAALAENVTISFDGAFSLEMPAGWLTLPADTEAAYSLCSADGRCRMLVEYMDADCADIEALQAFIEESYPEGEKIRYTYGDGEFVIFDLADEDASCASTLLDGRILSLVFMPRSDAGFMTEAIGILNSYRN